MCFLIVNSRQKFAFRRQFKFSKPAKEKKVGGGYLAIHYFAPRSTASQDPAAHQIMRTTDDSYLHKGLRRQLVDIIQQKGITDERVLEAIGTLPRHFFMDSAFDKIAYEDRAFPIGEGQTISQPYTVAYQSQLLEVKPFEKVLEIGTGSAYQACVLAELGVTVYTIERQKSLFDSNKTFAFL